MKVLFKNLLAGYTGKADDCVIYYNSKANCCIIRRRPRFKNNPSNDNFRQIMANLRKIKPSHGYISDLHLYLNLYNKLPGNRNRKLITWNNLWYKMLWAMQRTAAGIELKTLTRDQIIATGLPCRTVKTAVDAGLIPKVKGYQYLVNQI